MSQIAIKNSGDWPKNLQPDVDVIAALDGDKSNISLEDISLAQSRFCAVPEKGSETTLMKEILCPSRNKRTPEDSLKMLYAMRYGLSFDNPIHRAIKLETSRFPASDERTWEIIDHIYRLLSGILEATRKTIEPEMEPQKKMRVVFAAMAAAGINIRKECVPGLFISDIIDKSVDCDTSSFIFAAVAHELKWPVTIIYMPNHVMARWDDGKVKFNIDFGEIRDADFYREVAGVKDPEKGKFKFEQADFMFYFSYGNVLYKRRDYKGALAAFDRTIELNPGVPFSEAYGNRCAVELYFDNKKEDAIADCNQAIKINPDNENAYNSLGVVYGMLGKLDEALKNFDLAISKKPDYAEAHHNRGNVNFGRGRYQEAIDDCKRAIKSNPNYAPAYRLLEAAKQQMKAQHEGSSRPQPESTSGCSCNLLCR